MSVPVARRIVVGVDFSAESAAALRWACREASLRGAEVLAVHVSEGPCHNMASYAVPACAPPGEDAGEDAGADVMWQSVMPVPMPAVPVRTEVVEGLAARVLLDRCAGADMLVLGTATDTPGAMRSAGPVIRACLRRAFCPVVVISVAQEQLPREQDFAPEADVDLPVRLPVGAGVGPAVMVPAPSGMGLTGSSAKGVPVPAGA